jgi:hypothetical protein
MEHSMPPRKQTTTTGKARVGSYTRRDGTRVRHHQRTVNPWRDAGVAWAGAAVSGATTAAVVLELGLTLISTVAILLTVIIGAVAVKATNKATKQRRTMRTRAKASPRSRPAAARSRTTTGTSARRRQ